MFKRNNFLVLMVGLLVAGPIRSAALDERVIGIPPFVYACAAIGATGSEFDTKYSKYVPRFKGCVNKEVVFFERELLMYKVRLSNVVIRSKFTDTNYRDYSVIALTAIKSPEWDGVYERGCDAKGMPEMDRQAILESLRSRHVANSYDSRQTIALVGYGLGGYLTGAFVGRKDITKYAVTFNAPDITWQRSEEKHFVAEEYCDMPEFSSPKSNYIIVPKRISSAFADRPEDVAEILKGLVNGGRAFAWADIPCSREREEQLSLPLGSLLDFRMRAGGTRYEKDTRDYRDRGTPNPWGGNEGLGLDDPVEGCVSSFHAGRDSEYAREADAVEREYAHGSRIRKMREQKERDRDAERQRERERER